MTEYPASKLTIMALHWMREQYPNALLTTELCTEKYAAARLDVGAITDNEIMGVEIKGDGDSPARLNRQGWVYGRAASRMWLLAAPSIRQKVLKHRPAGWNDLKVIDGTLSCPRTSAKRLANSPAALLDILWKDELLSVSGDLGIPNRKQSTVEFIADNVAESAPLGDLRTAVCKALRARDWEALLNKTVYRPGSELPKISDKETPEEK